MAPMHSMHWGFFIVTAHSTMLSFKALGLGTGMGMQQSFSGLYINR